MKVAREPKRIIIDIFKLNLILIVRNKINIHPPTSPSEPSIKFVKFITAVIQITRKIKIKTFNIGLKKRKSIFPNLKTKKDVRSWIKYLYIEGTLTKSSKKLIKINGMHNKDNGILSSKLLKKPNTKS